MEREQTEVLQQRQRDADAAEVQRKRVMRASLESEWQRDAEARASARSPDFSRSLEHFPFRSKRSERKGTAQGIESGAISCRSAVTS